MVESTNDSQHRSDGGDAGLSETNERFSNGSNKNGFHKVEDDGTLSDDDDSLTNREEAECELPVPPTADLTSVAMVKGSKAWSPVKHAIQSSYHKGNCWLSPLSRSSYLCRVSTR